MRRRARGCLCLSLSLSVLPTSFFLFPPLSPTTLTPHINHLPPFPPHLCLARVLRRRSALPFRPALLLVVFSPRTPSVLLPHLLPLVIDSDVGVCGEPRGRVVHGAL